MFSYAVKKRRISDWINHRNQLPGGFYFIHVINQYLYVNNHEGTPSCFEYNVR